MIYFLFFNQPLIQMYSGINIKAKAKNCTNIEGIEVHSSILSERFEINSATIVIAKGRSLDCHLLIMLKYIKNGKNIGNSK